MKTPRKSSTVSKRTTSQEKLKAHLWDEFLKASSIPWDELSEDWKVFFYEQGDIVHASERLEELAIKAVEEKGNDF
jgi:hypothetical protein